MAKIILALAFLVFCAKAAQLGRPGQFIGKVDENSSAEIDRPEKLDEDDLEVLRQKRMAGMKKQQAKKQEWLSNGHGSYEEIPEEKEFFNVTKKSENVVVHFYKDDSFR